MSDSNDSAYEDESIKGDTWQDFRAPSDIPMPGPMPRGPRWTSEDPDYIFATGDVYVEADGSVTTRRKYG